MDFLFEGEDEFMSELNSLQAAVCEDVPADAALLVKMVEESGIPTDVRVFESGEALLESFKPGMYDVIFMDIYMGGMRGVDAASVIREIDPAVVIAFSTTSLDHTLESYRLKAFRYIEKPTRADTVKETLEYARLKRKAAPFITLKVSGGRKENIPLDSILYIESRGHVVEVHTFSGMTATSQSVSLDDMEQLLPPRFLRTHKSYLVNLDHVVKADRDMNVFVMKNGHRPHIRRGMFGKCEEALKLRLIEIARRDDN